MDNWIIPTSTRPSLDLRSPSDSIKILLVAGALPNAKRPKFNDTALHLAAMEGRNNAITILLDNDADRHLCNFNGHTPIDLAIDQSHKKSIELLRVPPHTIQPPTLSKSSLNTITIQWLVPQSKGSPIINYTIRVYLDADTSTNALHVPPTQTISEIDGASTTHTIHQCTPGVLYHISVQACNEAGWSKMESKRTPMRARPTPPAAPPVPYVVTTETTRLILDWKNNKNNGYSIDKYEIGYRVVRLTPTPTTRRRLTPNEASDQAICDRIVAAETELTEAKRQEKVWLAIFAPLGEHNIKKRKSVHRVMEAL